MSTPLAGWDRGSYGDGALGHDHTRAQCAHVLVEFNGPRDIIEALRGEMSDDGWEEQAACDFLNETAATDGAFWGWQDGDFGLWIEADDLGA